MAEACLAQFSTTTHLRQEVHGCLGLMYLKAGTPSTDQCQAHKRLCGGLELAQTTHIAQSNHRMCEGANRTIECNHAVCNQGGRGGDCVVTVINFRQRCGHEEGRQVSLQPRNFGSFVYRLRSACRKGALPASNFIQRVKAEERRSGH